MDRVLRHYFIALEPGLQNLDFELPVRVRAGSWEALIPETLEQWLKAGAGAAITTYVVTAAKKAAENDIGDRGLKDLIRNAFRGAQWFIRVGKHLGRIERSALEQAKIDSENLLIGIPNKEGEFLWIPKFHFDLLQSAPSNLLSGVASVVNEETTLVIGVVEEEDLAEVRVSHDVRSIFVEEEEEEEILFPELEHGMKVELEGRVTRGNGESNTIGFKYIGHILTCIPESGSIIRFKTVMFSRAKIVGVITRELAEGELLSPRPKIIFSDLYRIGVDSRQGDLF